MPIVSGGAVEIVAGEDEMSGLRRQRFLTVCVRFCYVICAICPFEITGNIFYVQFKYYVKFF
jgi:hypothetical protein